ncbi:hypothetical protein HIM_01715 [Hirsutella minnesotensis 3608]|nr:hypothetical protein HIM_01715 [Hirsutella minnesotensis 3608]
MPLEKIYVIRHGFRSNWLVDPATGTYSAYIPSPTGIPADPALTSHGVSQAKELGQHLMTLDPPIEAVYSSPFYRCLQTLGPYMQLRQEMLQQQQPQQSQLGLDHPRSETRGSASIRLEHGIREWFGSAPFDHPQPATDEVLSSLFPSIDQQYVPIIVPSQRGETLAQLQERVAIALRGIIEQCDKEDVRRVVLCTHAAVIIVLGRILTGNIPESIDIEDFHAYTCGLSVFQRVSAAESPEWESKVSASVSPDVTAHLIGGWHCELNSDCSFLSGGQERGWKFTGDESFPGTQSLSQGDIESKL